MRKRHFLSCRQFEITRGLDAIGKNKTKNVLSTPPVFCFSDFGWVAMTSEECPAPLGSISSAGPGQNEEYSPAHADDIIEEVGPGDDVSIGSDLSTLVVPFPELAPVVFFCLKQTTCPRSWCIRMVSSPYPFIRRWGQSEV